VARAGNSDVEALLPRMRDGDREAAADFMTRYASRIQRRIRGKLSPAMRRIYDSQDILSTVSRRLDVYVRAGKLEALSADQFWALVLRMANNAVVDKARVFRRLEHIEGSDGPLARQIRQRLNDAEARRRDGAAIEIERAMRLFDDPIDRDILSSWLMGTPHSVTADAIGLSAAAVRKRWQGIRGRLQERFASEMTG
jgi:DNA-directed RNA polymerase specialized sigma24 family protein